MAKPVVLVVRDGWGKNPSHQWDRSNAVLLANTPVDDAIVAEYPSTLIATSGFDVGLPEGTMGNSEVGHQNLGAGRIVDQESVRITKAIRTGDFFANAELNRAVDHAEKQGTKLHLFGIVSDAGVHGMLDHLYGLLELCKRRAFTNVFLHAFTDGRDSPPIFGLKYIKALEAKMAELGVGRIASVSGRFWAMDRDNRWPRVEKAYRAIALGEGPGFTSATAAVQYYYDHPTEPGTNGDEFVTPSIVTHDNGLPIATVGDGDAVIFYNYRGDRPRELTRAFVQPDFTGFARPKQLDLYFVTMTAYEQALPVHVAYPKLGKMHNILAQFVAERGLKQFRCAETEKFPHVTFFFNDYREEPFPGEDRGIVASRKLLPDGTPLTTYDQLPEMSAHAVRDTTVNAILTGIYDLVVVNFANGDMVGHTGSLPAAIKACEVVDQCVGAVIEATQKMGGSLIVTADHGNAEQMVDPQTNGPHTAHTTYTVELVVVDDRFKGHKLRPEGRLADVAPTLLRMMGLTPPEEMTGQSLIV
ncbi:MAG TPA: 2,3-bisphosphoglycerate-independent phosphoglycerate mutase [Tepidisphaeraceae bacterium]|jgi:2,3-bisphosphoglycerate-independent phosphoglycerate mutase